MERKWTKAQSCAIETRNKTLLVSAAAGSGKTAALTERIIRSVTDTEDPADISKMLIVTFTRAAAAELRQRIFKAVSDALAKDPQNKHLQMQMINMSSAKICTIDSFYLEVIRSNFDRLSISPKFRTADAAELDVLARSVMEDAIDAFYEKDGEGFSNMTQCFVGLRNSAKLPEIFLDLYSKIGSYPDGVEFLKGSAERVASEANDDFFKTSFGKVLCENVVSELEYYHGNYCEMCETMLSECEDAVSDAYFASFAYDKGFLERLISLMNEGAYEDCRKYAQGYSPLKLSSLSKKFKTEQSEELKNRRTALVKKIRAAIAKSFKLSSESIAYSMRRTAQITESLYELICDFETRFDAEKKQKNIASFGDIRRYALQLLIDRDGQPTEVAKQYAERFSDVYIDEYQDVDRVQDMIFRAISKRDNRFMVGDIKQSIYSFRGAEPEVFASYRKTFPEAFSESDQAEASDSVSIFMSNNFRCDKTVIDFTNTVCSYIFSACADSIGYTSDDDLVYSKIEENRKLPEMPVEISVIVPAESDGEEEGDDAEKAELDSKAVEARYIARQISELLKSGIKADGTKILPHDIAVLFRTKAMGEYVRRALTEIGISCSDNTDAEYFENPDVLLILCLLNAIDNPHRDVYLAGLLRSPFFLFSLDELIEIRRSFDISGSLYDALCEYSKGESELSGKALAFIEYLDELREMSRSLTVDKLLRYLFSTDMLLRSGLVSSDDGNNLMRLYEYARRFEGSSYKGLYNFIVYINKIIEQNTKMDAPSGQTETGKVTLMTVHQSKGLEFPVCFLCNTGGKFNAQDIRESLLCDSRLGVAMKISDDTGLARINTPMREAIIKLSEAGLVEEEMRVLYVALTRARERLFISATSRKTPEKLISDAAHSHTHRGKYTVCSAHSYIEWILAALGAAEESNFHRLCFIPEDTVLGAENDTADREAFTDGGNEERSVEYSRELYDTLREKFSFVYPFAEATRLPAKISVSRLLPESESMKNEGETRLFEEEREYIPPAILTDGAKRAPSAAERGTATHLFLQFCNFEYAEKNGVDAEIARLTEKRFLPSNCSELMFCDEIKKFFDSELYRDLKKAKRIVREQRFNILLDPSALNDDEEFIRQTEGEMLAVQGVIDLLWEDGGGEIYLCDYKTDRLSRAELSDDSLLRRKMTERHAKQLKYYAEAIRRLFSRECKKIFIYSTHAAKSVEIDVSAI